MKKVFAIAYKDLLLSFRDAAALIMMLATPFGLTLVIGFAFGGLGGQSGATLQDIPVLILNADQGSLGQGLVEIFQSADLAELVEPELVTGAEAARQRVDQDAAAAFIFIPPDFSDRIFFSNRQQAASDPVQVEVYGNPGRPVSVGVARSIVDIFLSRVNAGAVSGRVAVEGLIRSGLISAEAAQSVGQQVSETAAQQAGQAASLLLVHVRGADYSGAEYSGAGDSVSTGGGGFDWLAFSAPSMAILFLMFTVTAGGRTILAEREQGTLPRMLVSPSTPAQVLGGKVVGIFLTGVAQVSILLLAGRLLLGIEWGDALAAAALVLALVFAATGWGVLLAAYGRSAGQVSAAGTALALIFGAAGGNFVPRPAMPEWLQTASYISPNAWGLEAFLDLAAGARLADLAVPILALLAMGTILSVISLFAFRRQYKR